MLPFLWQYAIIQPHTGYLYDFQMVFDPHTKKISFWCISERHWDNVTHCWMCKHKVVDIGNAYYPSLNKRRRNSIKNTQVKKEWKIQNIAENSCLDLKAFKRFKTSVWILKGSRAQSCAGNRHNRTDCIPVRYPLIQTLHLTWSFFQHLIISPVWCYTYNERLCRELVLKKADIWR